MQKQANQMDDDDEPQSDGSEDHQQPHDTQPYEQTRSEQADQCQFDDFAMI
jgi:hypothetical protein